MMYQPVENTACCLNCTNQWPAVWASKELVIECPRCRWKLGVPTEFISSVATDDLASVRRPLGCVIFEGTLMNVRQR